MQRTSVSMRNLLLLTLLHFRMEAANNAQNVRHTSRKS